MKVNRVDQVREIIDMRRPVVFETRHIVQDLIIVPVRIVLVLLSDKPPQRPILV